MSTTKKVPPSAGKPKNPPNPVVEAAQSGVNFRAVLRRTNIDPEKPKSPEDDVQQVDFRSVLKRKNQGQEEKKKC